MKTDIQIAQEATMMHIKDVADKLGVKEEELEFYRKYKASYRAFYTSTTLFTGKSAS